MFIISGMLDAGIGEAHVNKFLTALGINSVSNGMLKRREREVGSCVEELAKELCARKPWRKRGDYHRSQIVMLILLACMHLLMLDGKNEAVVACTPFFLVMLL